MYMRTTIKIALGIIVALPLIVFAGFKVAEVRYLKGFLPPAYGTVVLQNKTSLVAGIGPGGYDAVLAFFRLPENVANRIELGGLSWLLEAEKSVKLRRSEISGEWLATPLSADTFGWVDGANCEQESNDWWIAKRTGHSCPGIAAYLRGVSFLDRLDVSKTETVDDILRSETAYISKRRLGYLIVAPERRLVVFAHAG